MGSVPMKIQQDKLMKRFHNKQERRKIYDKWKYEIENCEIIQCRITFNNRNDFDTNSSITNMTME